MKRGRQPREGNPAWILVFVAWAGLACGCASTPATRASNHATIEVGECLSYLEALDGAASAHGVIDAEAARVPGYPFLRTDRFLASFPPGTLDPDTFGEWLERLQALDLDGRRIEIANLPGQVRADLAVRFGLGRYEPQPLVDRVARCGTPLRRSTYRLPRPLC